MKMDVDVTGDGERQRERSEKLELTCELVKKTTKKLICVKMSLHGPADFCQSIFVASVRRMSHIQHGGITSFGPRFKSVKIQ